MTKIDNNWVVGRIIEEVIRNRNFDAIYNICSADYIDHSPSPGQRNGPDGLRAVLEEYLAAFPDLAIEIQDIIASGDKVVTRELWIGTHTGRFRGILPTGREITRTVIHIFRIADGRITDEWSEGSDLLRQLTAGSPDGVIYDDRA